MTTIRHLMPATKIFNRREINTDSQVLRQVQDALRDVQHSTVDYRFGIPTNIAQDIDTLKLGDLALINARIATKLKLQGTDLLNVGEIITVKITTTNPDGITIIPSFAGTIDGASSYTMTADYGNTIFICAGKNEWITG